MTVTEEQLKQIAEVLAEWNPLGEASAKVADLEGYRTEAEDIAFGLAITGPFQREPKTARLTREVLNQAFGLNLALADCLGPAARIQAILEKG